MDKVWSNVSYSTSIADSELRSHFAKVRQRALKVTRNQFKILYLVQYKLVQKLFEGCSFTCSWQQKLRYCKRKNINTLGGLASARLAKPDHLSFSQPENRVKGPFSRPQVGIRRPLNRLVQFRKTPDLPNVLRSRPVSLPTYPCLSTRKLKDFKKICTCSHQIAETKGPPKPPKQTKWIIKNTAELIEVITLSNNCSRFLWHRWGFHGPWDHWDGKSSKLYIILLLVTYRRLVVFIPKLVTF